MSASGLDHKRTPRYTTSLMLTRAMNVKHWRAMIINCGYSMILLYRSSGDRDEYFDISKFRYNRSSFVLTLCPAGLQIELRYKRNFDMSEFDITGLCCSLIISIFIKYSNKY